MTWMGSIIIPMIEDLCSYFYPSKEGYQNNCVGVIILNFLYKRDEWQAKVAWVCAPKEWGLYLKRDLWVE